MHPRSRSLKLMCCASMILAVNGCGVFFGGLVDPTLSDGGGGNILTAGLKVVEGQMTTLTQDELQILSQQINSLIAATNPDAPTLDPLTNDQADAVIEFLVANDLNMLEDFQTIVDNIDSVIIPESLITAFAGTDVNLDGDTLTEEDLNMLINSIFPTG